MGLLPTRDAPPGFQELADATPALIWVDAATRAAPVVNRGWLEFTGAGPDADLGLAGAHPSRRPGALHRVRAAARGPSSSSTGCARRTAVTGGCSTAAPRSGDRRLVGGCLDIDAGSASASGSGCWPSSAPRWTARRRCPGVGPCWRAPSSTRVWSTWCGSSRWRTAPDRGAGRRRAHIRSRKRCWARSDDDWMQAREGRGGRRGAASFAGGRGLHRGERIRRAAAEAAAQLGFALGRARPGGRPRPTRRPAGRGRAHTSAPSTRPTSPCSSSSANGPGRRSTTRCSCRRAGQPRPAGGAAPGDRRALRRGDTRAGRPGRRGAVRPAVPGDGGGTVAARRRRRGRARGRDLAAPVDAVARQAAPRIPLPMPPARWPASPAPGGPSGPTRSSSHGVPDCIRG